MTCSIAGSGLVSSSRASEYGVLPIVVLVQAASCSAVNGSIQEAVPVWMRATYPGPSLFALLVGFGTFGLGNERTPLPFRITTVPLGRIRTAVGYQPAGMKPSTRLRSCDTSNTAVALASEHATYKRLPSGLSANPEGVMPSGWRGVIDTLMLSTKLSSLPSAIPTA